MKRAHLSVLLACVLSLCLVSATAESPENLPAPPGPPAFSAVISRVIDGETLEVVRQGQRVRLRLFDVDCPELAETNGERAQQITARTVGRTRLWIFPSGRRTTDVHGQMLVRVWTPNGWLSDVLIEAGAATRYMDPDEPTVYITRAGSKYHREGCGHLRESRIPISLPTAKAQGYEPCSRCGPPN